MTVDDPSFPKYQVAVLQRLLPRRYLFPMDVSRAMNDVIGRLSQSSLSSWSLPVFFFFWVYFSLWLSGSVTLSLMLDHQIMSSNYNKWWFTFCTLHFVLPSEQRPTYHAAFRYNRQWQLIFIINQSLLTNSSNVLRRHCASVWPA